MEELLSKHSGWRAELVPAVVVGIGHFPQREKRSETGVATIPWRYLKGVSGGKMGEALKALVGGEVVSRLKRK